MSVVICREFNKKKNKGSEWVMNSCIAMLNYIVIYVAAVTELPGTSNMEVIYEQCGGWYNVKHSVLQLWFLVTKKCLPCACRGNAIGFVLPCHISLTIQTLLSLLFYSLLR